MIQAAWYLRRAVPWAALSGCLVTGAVLAALPHAWDSLAGLTLPLLVLVSAAAAAFVFDDPAVAITVVAPRGKRWASALRLAVALLPLGVGIALLRTTPGDPDLSEWTLVLFALTGAVLAGATVAARHQVARPGGALAATVVLLGLVPLVLGVLGDVGTPYPAPALGSRWIWFWTILATVAWLVAMALTAMPPGRAPRATTRVHGEATVSPRTPGPRPRGHGAPNAGSR